MGNSSQYYLVVTTVSGLELAEKMSRALVEERLAACVNIADKISSIYSWKGEIVQDKECMLLIKTKKSLFENLKEKIIQLHPYEVPEIIAIPLEKGHKAYFDWIDDSTK